MLFQSFLVIDTFWESIVNINLGAAASIEKDNYYLDDLN